MSDKLLTQRLQSSPLSSVSTRVLCTRRSSNFELCQRNISKFISTPVLHLCFVDVFKNTYASTCVSNGLFPSSFFLFNRNIDSMPKVLQYFTYIGVQKYASEILVAHEYPNLKLSCGNNTSTDFCRYPTGDDYLKAVFPDAVADLNRNYYCMTGFCAGIFVVAMMIFSLRSYIKRR